MIDFVERDIISRRRVYAKLVNQGKLSPNAAEFNLHVMDNVLILLRKQL